MTDDMRVAVKIVMERSEPHLSPTKRARFQFHRCSLLDSHDKMFREVMPYDWERNSARPSPFWIGKAESREVRQILMHSAAWRLCPVRQILSGWRTIQSVGIIKGHHPVVGGARLLSLAPSSFYHARCSRSIIGFSGNLIRPLNDVAINSIYEIWFLLAMFSRCVPKIIASRSFAGWCKRTYSICAVPEINRTRLVPAFVAHRSYSCQFSRPENPSIYWPFQPMPENQFKWLSVQTIIERNLKPVLFVRSNAIFLDE